MPVRFWIHALLLSLVLLVQLLQYLDKLQSCYVGYQFFNFCMAKCIYLMKVHYCYFFETMWSPDKSNSALIFPVWCA